MIVLACHTVSTQCLGQIFKVPVIGMVEGSLRVLQGYRIAILGTQATIDSGVYQSLIGHAEIFPVACPLLVPLIEQGLDPEMAARKYVGSLNVDSVLLACTHYPLIREVIQKVMGERVILLDPAEQIAMDVKKYLGEKGLLNDMFTPQYQFYVTDQHEIFIKRARSFLNREIVANFIEINPKYCVYKQSN